MKRGAVNPVLLWGIVGLCALFCGLWGIRKLLCEGPLFPDFFGLWSFGRYVAQGGQARALYDNAILAGYQAMLGMPETHSANYPYPYPPWTLLVLAPLGAMPYGLARIVWAVASAVVCLLALPRRALGPYHCLAVLAPPMVICAIVGQSGMLLAAALLTGARLLQRHEMAAGLVLSLLVLKPQFAPLVPCALLFGRYWVALGAFAGGVAALFGASMLAFGSDAWLGWLDFMRQSGAALSAGRGGSLTTMMPTLGTSLRALGSGHLLATAAQGAGVVAALFVVWRMRHRRGVELAAVLGLSTFLATPYAFHYDLPIACLCALAWAMDRPAQLASWMCLILLPVELLTHVAIAPLLVMGAVIACLVCVMRAQPYGTVP